MRARSGLPTAAVPAAEDSALGQRVKGEVCAKLGNTTRDPVNLVQCTVRERIANRESAQGERRSVLDGVARHKPETNADSTM